MEAQQIDIKEGLKNLDIHITEKDLKDPDNLDMIYSRLAEHSFGHQFNEISPLCEEGLEFVNTDQDHLALNRFHFLDKLKRLLALVGINDFSFIDILNPNIKKTKKVIGAILQFLQYKEQQKEIFKEILVKNDEINENIREQKVIINQLEQETTNMIKQKEQERPQFLNLSSSMEMKNGQLEQQMKLKQEKQNILQKEEERYRQIMDKNKANEYEIQHLKEQNHSLELRIAKAPSRIQVQYDESVLEMGKKKNEILNIDSAIQRNLYEIQDLKKFEEKFNDICFNQLKECYNTRQSLDELQQREKTYKQTLIDLEKIYDDKKEIFYQLEKQEQEQLSAAEFLKTRIKQTEKQYEQNAKNTDQNKDKCQKTQQVQYEIQEIQKEINKINEKREILEKNGREQLQSLMNYQQNLISEFQEYRLNIRCAYFDNYE